MLACAPDNGNMTPTFSGAPCAWPMLNGEVPATIATAPAPAAKPRRLTPARAGVVCDLRIMRVLPGCGSARRSGRRVPPSLMVQREMQWPLVGLFVAGARPKLRTIVVHDNRCRQQQ